MDKRHRVRYLHETTVNCAKSARPRPWHLGEEEMGHDRRACPPTGLDLPRPLFDLTSAGCTHQGHPAYCHHKQNARFKRSFTSYVLHSFFWRKHCLIMPCSTSALPMARTRQAHRPQTMLHVVLRTRRSKRLFNVTEARQEVFQLLGTEAISA